MKYFWLFTFVIIICSCKNKTVDVPLLIAEEDSLESFFPVTDYLKGQLAIIKDNPLNPLKIESFGKKSDSVYVKIEDLDSLLDVFMHPVIDTANLMNAYKQSRFYDKTIDLYTLSYEAKDPGKLKEGLLNWVVYVSPQNNMVNRVYLIKELPNKNKLQLTWQSDKQCTIVEVGQSIKNPDENAVVKQTQIIWKF